MCVVISSSVFSLPKNILRRLVVANISVITKLTCYGSCRANIKYTGRCFLIKTFKESKKSRFSLFQVRLYLCLTSSEGV